MEFRILGPLEVTAGGRPLEVGGARARAVLAMLIVHANRVVPADRLAEELWPGQPPGKAAASLQVRVSELRKAFRSAGEADRLVTQPPGYLLRVAPGELDAARFAALAAQAGAALTGGDPSAAAGQLDEALALWHGDPLAGLDAAPFARAEAGRLAEARLAALESRAGAALACGQPAGGLIAGLETLTAAHPLRERLWGQLMLALYRAGRQADALRAYRDLRALLVRELGIEPGPDLRELHAQILRQDPALAGPAALGGGPDVPPIRYARSDDGVHLAYQVLGQGERDIVFVPGLMSHLELLWEDPETAGFFRRLAALGRLILFDKRDTGLSDRVPGDSTLEERMNDVRAVMQAASSTRAVLFGYSEGAPMSILFAATYPDRVTALILGSAAARWFPAPDYPCGPETEEMYQALTGIAEHRWGQGDTIDWYLPSRSGSAHARQLVARFERMAISPSGFLRMVRMIREIDVRPVLPAIHVPTLVIQRLGDRITPPFHGRYLAAHISRGPLLRAARRSFAAVLRQRGQRRAVRRDRWLPGWHRPAPRPGPGAGHDAGGRDRLRAGWPDGRVAACVAAWGQQVVCHRGRLISGAAGRALAVFDAPGQAIRCAAALLDSAAAHGIQLRAGIHTGEVELARRRHRRPFGAASPTGSPPSPGPPRSWSRARSGTWSPGPAWASPAGAVTSWPGGQKNGRCSRSPAAKPCQCHQGEGSAR